MLINETYLKQQGIKDKNILSIFKKTFSNGLELGDWSVGLQRNLYKTEFGSIMNCLFLNNILPKYHNIGLDLHKEKLYDIRFNDEDLSDSNFSKSIIKNMSIHSSMSEDVSFKETSVVGLCVHFSKLSHVIFKESILTNLSFTCSELSNSDFTYTTITGSFLLDMGRMRILPQ